MIHGLILALALVIFSLLSFLSIRQYLRYRKWLVAEGRVVGLGTDSGLHATVRVAYKDPSGVERVLESKIANEKDFKTLPPDMMPFKTGDVLSIRINPSNFSEAKIDLGKNLGSAFLSFLVIFLVYVLVKYFG